MPLLKAFWLSPPGLALGAFVAQRLAAGAVIYPDQPLRALELTPLAGVRVVIVGQDPYHGPDQAHGLAFSVQAGQRVPPSLRNIFSEIERSLPPQPAPGVQARAPRSGALEPWARQGVLLLNTCLTVESGAPGSHAKQGWEALTDEIIKAVACSETPTVFMLWGAHAQAKQALVSSGRHLVLAANHPSPLSARRPPGLLWVAAIFPPPTPGLSSMVAGLFYGSTPAENRGIIRGSLAGWVSEWLKEADCKSVR